MLFFLINIFPGEIYGRYFLGHFITAENAFNQERAEGDRRRTPTRSYSGIGLTSALVIISFRMRAESERHAKGIPLSKSLSRIAGDDRVHPPIRSPKKTYANGVRPRLLVRVPHLRPLNTFRYGSSIEESSGQFINKHRCVLLLRVPIFVTLTILRGTRPEKYTTIIIIMIIFFISYISR